MFIPIFINTLYIHYWFYPVENNKFYLLMLII